MDEDAPMSDALAASLVSEEPTVPTVAQIANAYRTLRAEFGAGEALEILRTWERTRRPPT